MMDAGNRQGMGSVYRIIKENKYILLFIFVYAFILTMANEFFFASNRMQNYDQAIYQYIGHLITEGKMPYVDAFDHKGPLVYLIYAASCLISIKWGAWLINFLVMAGTIGGAYCIARRFTGKAWAAVICLVLYSGFITLDFRGGTPEFFAGLFFALSLYYLVDYYQTQDLSRKNLLILGVCGACIFWLKHSTLITLLLLCAFIIIECLIKKKIKTVFNYILWYAVGFFAVSLVVCGWLFTNHAGRAMIADYFLANLLYAGNTTLFNRVQSFLYLSSHSSVVIIWMLLFGYLVFQISCKMGEKRERKEDHLILHTTVSLVLSLLFFAMPGRNYYHYLSTLFPLFVLIAAYLVRQLSFVKLQNRYMICTVALATVFCLIVYPNFQQIFSASVNAWTEDASKTQLINTINQYADNDGRITVLGGSAGLYLASGHESATIYPYISSAVLNDPKRGEDYREQVKNNRPEVILAEPQQDEYELLGYEILREYYLMDTISDTKVYVRKDRVEISSSIEILEHVVDLESYLSLLSDLEDCTIFFAVKNTQGYQLNEQIIDQMEILGFEQLEELLGEEYHSFAGIVQNGQALYQMIGNQDEAIRYDGIVNGCSVRLESKTIQCGNQASIQIDGIDYSINKRGLNIVVYNNKTYEVINSVAFDTHSENYICYR